VTQTDLVFKNNIQLKNLKSNSRNYLIKRYNKILLEIKKDLKNNKKTISVLDDNFKLNIKIKDLKKFKKFHKIAFVGMGGSILGVEAVYNFFQLKITKKIYFFNNIDEKKIISFKKKENLSKVLFVIISKSGNTVETLSNTFSLNVIKKKANNIILISEKNNLLSSLSKELNLFHIEHRDYIGGRYSVLSEAGLIPAYLMGINIKKFRSKILNCFDNKNLNFLKESTIKLTSLISSKKFSSLIFLNYSPELEKFLYWCQQLLAESLGKKNKGLLPMVSTAPKDHHSLLQLYLDGPNDKIFNIFSFENNSELKTTIPKGSSVGSFFNKKKLNKIKNAQRHALIKVFKKKQIPFREFKIKKNNEEVLGKLFSLFITETIIIGKLLNINPFDQPAVEQVKVYTKKLLS
tara:strand:+ start:1543 stop:2757 length:1215 start_codon:yes stop_codon:yes gene_type:complete